MILAYAKYMAERGLAVEIITSRVETVFPLPRGVKITKLGSKAKVSTLWEAIKMRINADFLIADIIPLACLLAIRNRRKLIYFAQDYDESYYSSKFHKFIIRLLYYWGLSLVRIRTIAVAQHLGDLLRKRFSARISIVENGVDTEKFFPDPDSELLARKGNNKAILLLSRSDPRKGFDLGCRIFREVRSHYKQSDLELWTVGEPSGNIFEETVHRDFGYVPPERLRQILSSADIFLYHTRHEGFPLMALESLACGCPMVASSAVKVLKHEKEALISPIGDIVSAREHVIKLLTDPGISLRLKEEGLKFAHRHSLQQGSARFLEKLLGQC